MRQAKPLQLTKYELNLVPNKVLDNYMSREINIKKMVKSWIVRVKQ